MSGLQGRWVVQWVVQWVALLAVAVATTFGIDKVVRRVCALRFCFGMRRRLG